MKTRKTQLLKSSYNVQIKHTGIRKDKTYVHNYLLVSGLHYLFQLKKWQVFERSMRFLIYSVDPNKLEKPTKRYDLNFWKSFNSFVSFNFIILCQSINGILSLPNYACNNLRNAYRYRNVYFKLFSKYGKAIHPKYV